MVGTQSNFIGKQYPRRVVLFADAVSGDLLQPPASLTCLHTTGCLLGSSSSSSYTATSDARRHERRQKLNQRLIDAARTQNRAHRSSVHITIANRDLIVSDAYRPRLTTLDRVWLIVGVRLLR